MDWIDPTSTCLGKMAVANPQVLRARMEKYFNGDGDKGDARLVITRVEEREFGWLFHYTSARYLETRQISDLLCGNYPVFVGKDTGTVLRLGSQWESDLKGLEPELRARQERRERATPRDPVGPRRSSFGPGSPEGRGH